VARRTFSADERYLLISHQREVHCWERRDQGSESSQGLRQHELPYLHSRAQRTGVLGDRARYPSHVFSAHAHDMVSTTSTASANSFQSIHTTPPQLIAAETEFDQLDSVTSTPRTKLTYRLSPHPCIPIWDHPSYKQDGRSKRQTLGLVLLLDPVFM
jgi:hypothetical protein